MREGERGLKERLFVVWPAGGRRPQLGEGGHCLTDFRNVLYSTPRLVGGMEKKEAKERERVVVAVAAIAASRRSGALSESSAGSAGTNTTAIQLQNDRAVITGCCN